MVMEKSQLKSSKESWLEQVRKTCQEFVFIMIYISCHLGKMNEEDIVKMIEKTDVDSDG